MKKILAVLIISALCLSAAAGCNPFAPGQVKKTTTTEAAKKN